MKSILSIRKWNTIDILNSTAFIVEGKKRKGYNKGRTRAQSALKQKR